MAAICCHNLSFRNISLFTPFDFFKPTFSLHIACGKNRLSVFFILLLKLFKLIVGSIGRPLSLLGLHLSNTTLTTSEPLVLRYATIQVCDNVLLHVKPQALINGMLQ